MNMQKINGSIRMQSHCFKQLKIAGNSSLKKKEKSINLEETNLHPHNQKILKSLSKAIMKVTNSSQLKKISQAKKTQLKALSTRQMKLLTMDWSRWTAQTRLTI